MTTFSVWRAARLLALGCLALLTGCQQSFDERLAEEARDYTNAHCPERLDAYTVLDSIVYDRTSRTYHRHLTLDERTPAALLGNLPLVKQTLTRELQNDPAWNAARREGINFAYTYHIAQADTAFTVMLTPADYNR